MFKSNCRLFVTSANKKVVTFSYRTDICYAKSSTCCHISLSCHCAAVADKNKTNVIGNKSNDICRRLSSNRIQFCCLYHTDCRISDSESIDWRVESWNKWRISSSTGKIFVNYKFKYSYMLFEGIYRSSLERFDAHQTEFTAIDKTICTVGIRATVVANVRIWICEVEVYGCWLGNRLKASWSGCCTDNVQSSRQYSLATSYNCLIGLQGIPGLIGYPGEDGVNGKLSDK
jgi:hypothetical protein